MKAININKLYVLLFLCFSSFVLAPEQPLTKKPKISHVLITEDTYPRALTKLTYEDVPQFFKRLPRVIGMRIAYMAEAYGKKVTTTLLYYSRGCCPGDQKMKTTEILAYHTPFNPGANQTVEPFESHDIRTEITAFYDRLAQHDSKVTPIVLTAPRVK